MELRGTLRVCVLCENTAMCGLPNFPRAIRREMDKVCRDLLSAMRDQNLFVGLKKLFDAYPCISNQTGRRAGSFENARGWRKAIASHARSRDVQNRAWRAVKGVVIGCVNMAEVSDIRWQRFRVPSDAAQQKLPIRQLLSGAQKEFFHARLAIGQTMSEKTEMGLEARVGRDRMMRLRVQPVVDRDTRSRAERFVTAHHRRPT